MSPTSAEQRAREHFEQVTADHAMAILHDDGLYRHLRFQSPGTWVYGYDLVTWPGYLALNGDLVSGYTFARRDDMLLFFASGPDINPDYWAEKITNIKAREGTRTYSEEKFRATVALHLSDDWHGRDDGPVIRAAWAEHIECCDDLHFEEGARIALRDFDGPNGFHFTDTWEWDLREWDHVFLLCCFAIRAGVERYFAEQQPAASR